MPNDNSIFSSSEYFFEWWIHPWFGLADFLSIDERLENVVDESPWSTAR